MNPQEDNYSNDFFTYPEAIIGTTNLSTEQKILYRRRFLNKLYYIRREKHVLAVLYYMYKFFSVTLGVAIPALLSIQYYYTSGEGVQNPIYWSAWGLSLLGGFINGYTHIFKVEERFFLMRMFSLKNRVFKTELSGVTMARISASIIRKNCRLEELGIFLRANIEKKFLIPIFMHSLI